jgi:hypothetical protein
MSMSSVKLDDTDARIESEEGRLLIQFPRDGGVVQPAQWRFTDRDDLIKFLADRLGLTIENGGLRGTVHRRGKYARLSSHGAPIMSFGDPILDMITNEHGELRIGGFRFQIGANSLIDSHSSVGGTADTDLKPSEESSDANGSIVVEASSQASARIYVSARTFVRDGDTMRFRAFRRSGFFWKMGAQIVTTEQDFDEARIDSEYWDTYVQQTCAIVKIDSDHDNNDEFLEEYEWGINSPQPLRVKSLCTATWRGEEFGPTLVEKGEECFEVEF